MSDEQTRNLKIKQFEQKVINQSFTDLLFYDRLADYLLECCHSEAKPNTLSLFSFLPLFVLAFIVRGPSSASFLLTIIGILLHQLFDIANKKQAYRTQSFSLSTYYIDHLFDSLSSTFLVLIFSSLFQLSPTATLTAVFFFAILPFYTHHLAMYNNEYFTFSLISPATEGLVVTKLLFLIGVFWPSVFSTQIVGGIYGYQIYIGAAAIWLLVFILLDIKTIVYGKRITDNKTGVQEQYPLKNLFSVFVLGYATMEMTSIEPELLQDSFYFYMAFGVLVLILFHMIGNLIIAYAYQQKYKQISLGFLITIGIVIIYYFSCAFVLGGEELENLVSKIVLGTTFFAFCFYSLQDTWKNVAYINTVASG